MNSNAATVKRMRARLGRRRRAEIMFRALTFSAVIAALFTVGCLLVNLAAAGRTAFYQHFITIDVAVDAAIIDPTGTRDPDRLRAANYRKLVQDAMAETVGAADRQSRREALDVVSAAGATDALRQRVLREPAAVGGVVSLVVPVSDQVDQLLKGNIDRHIPEARRKITDRQLGWIDALVAKGAIKRQFNWGFFTKPDSRDAELAGVGAALAGSAMTLLLTLILSAPLGVGAALYLEEFAPKNAMTDFVEININNLAAVPSIVFGLLGLAVFLNYFDMPRSAPVVGGLVLSLMTLPTIIIASRAALAAVSPSVVDAALSVGASPVEAVFHHKLPLAAPGILTGTIIGMARALGETAPLLMIGMVAFVTEIPGSVTDPATVLPVQIFLWSDSAERAWAERTSAAIIVLLIMMLIMNGVAIFLRSRFERRW